MGLQFLAIEYNRLNPMAEPIQEVGQHVFSSADAILACCMQILFMDFKMLKSAMLNTGHL